MKLNSSTSTPTPIVRLREGLASVGIPTAPFTRWMDAEAPERVTQNEGALVQCAPLSLARLASALLATQLIDSAQCRALRSIPSAALPGLEGGWLLIRASTFAQRRAPCSPMSLTQALFVLSVLWKSRRHSPCGGALIASNSGDEEGFLLCAGLSRGRLTIGRIDETHPLAATPSWELLPFVPNGR